MRDRMCYCENCGRSSKDVEISIITIKKHVAELCLACAHVLTLSKNEARFLQLVRKKDKKHSNKDMRQVHQVLSALLAVGTLFLVFIVALGVSKNIDLTVVTTHLEPDTKPVSEYLTFAEINRYK
ncbi:MAG: DNA polymerase III subunit delta [Solibacillus sp.]|jgi:hypothetical protein|uniref:DNA polymerase III subunit delta n=1 Tax=unclassified Solibacillus TaxID=2637870 RepID=UPI0030FBEDFF